MVGLVEGAGVVVEKRKAFVYVPAWKHISFTVAAEMHPQHVGHHVRDDSVVVSHVEQVMAVRVNIPKVVGHERV